MPLRTVLFDLDGTLLDQFAAIHRCHAHAMRSVGLPAPTPERVRRAVGRGIEEAIRELAGADQVGRLLPVYLAHWEATGLDDVVDLGERTTSRCSPAPPPSSPRCASAASGAAC